MLQPHQLERWAASLESMLHDTDVAQLFLLGIHLDAALGEVYTLLGRARDQPKSELSGNSSPE